MKEGLVNCPNCDNDGWYYITNAETGEPEQCQCEFCHTVPNSVFNNQPVNKE